MTPIEAGEGSFELGAVPAAAHARLVAWRAGSQRSDPRTWKELAPFSLSAGRLTELE